MKSQAAVLHGAGRSSLHGEQNVRASPPMLLSMYEAASLKLGGLKLDEINDAVKHLRGGSSSRGVIDFDLGASK